MKTFTVKSNATRAAKKAAAAAGCPDAQSGTDFFIIEDSGLYAFTLAPQWRAEVTSPDDAIVPPADIAPAPAVSTPTALAAAEAMMEEWDVNVTQGKGDDTVAADTLAGLDTLDMGALAATPAPGALPEAAAKEKALGKRAQAKAAAEASAAAGELPEHLTIASAANPSYQKRADALRALAEAGDITGLKAAAFTGQNTYAAMLRRYHALLVTATEAALAKIGEA